MAVTKGYEMDSDQRDVRAVILHLSDIHILDYNDAIVAHAGEIAQSLFAVGRTSAHVIISITGDIAFSGKTTQYDVALKFVDKIKQLLTNELNVPVDVAVVPGNHDCDFDRNNSNRKSLAKLLCGPEPPHVDSSIIDACTSVQDEYLAFADHVTAPTHWEGDKLWKTHTFEFAGKRVAIDALNLSWLSQIHEEPGHLYFPISSYEERKASAVDLRIAMMHHPLNWLSQPGYRPFRKFIRRRSDIILTGHEHEGNFGIIDDAESDQSAFVEGSVLQISSRQMEGSGFNVIDVNLTRDQFIVIKYRWSDDHYAQQDTAVWSSYRDLPRKNSDEFSLSKSWEEVLDDPGPYLTESGRVRMQLSDIYVSPALSEVRSDDQLRKTIESDILLNSDEIKNGVIVEGEEKSGRTSLLYHLYRKYHDQGIIPLLIRGQQLRRAVEKDLLKVISDSVSQQYGPARVEKYNQLPRHRKLLLLDDFDEGRSNDLSTKAEVLRILREHFGLSIVTVGEFFEIRELIEESGDDQFDSMVLYRIRQFGFVLRSQLIKKWLSLSADGPSTDNDRLTRYDHAERTISLVMTKNLVPSVPLYLLTLLQSIEMGRGNDFKESSLGHYYHYLLTDSLLKAGVKPDKLTEVFQYSFEMAWYFHSRSSDTLEETELRKFNEYFSRKWITVDFKSLLETLVEARVLKRDGDQYSFRYPYIYYYLKGKYLSDNFNNIEIRKYITHASEHLYVREHANTVLFLAHHTNNDFVLTTISEALHRLYASNSPVTLQGDTDGIKSLLQEPPKLVYSAISPDKFREEQNKLRDQRPNSDGLMEAEEKSPNISVTAKLTMLFRTVEILGQILKNQYATIERTRKIALLEELFLAPLRGMSEFLKLFEGLPGVLGALEEARRKAEGAHKSVPQIEKAAKRLASEMIHLVAWVFIAKTSELVSAEPLLEDIEAVSARFGTLAVRLIEMGVILDSARKLPKRKLSNLSRDCKKEPVAFRVLQRMLLRWLYRFKATESDMLWVASELTIDIKTQHKITYQATRNRRSE
jgi:Calcineurin-like phosphoesterase